MVHPAKSHAIKGRAGELARVRPKVTHDHVLASAEAETIFPEVDALAGRGLPGDVEFALVLADSERTLERDQPRDRKDNRPRPGVRQRLRHRIAETAGAAVVEIGD